MSPVDQTGPAYDAQFLHNVIAQDAEILQPLIISGEESLQPMITFATDIMRQPGCQ